jgi:hypothetical protein
MPITWGRHDNKQIFLDVVILGAADAALVHHGQSPSRLQQFKALVDTGATGTCITPQTATKMGLAPIGKMAIQGVSALNTTTAICFILALWSRRRRSRWPMRAVRSNFSKNCICYPRPIQGAEFDAGGHGFDVLMGMDVITSGALTVGGNRTFSWAW